MLQYAAVAQTIELPGIVAIYSHNIMPQTSYVVCEIPANVLAGNACAQQRVRAGALLVRVQLCVLSHRLIAIMIT